MFSEENVWSSFGEMRSRRFSQPSELERGDKLFSGDKILTINKRKHDFSIKILSNNVDSIYQVFIPEIMPVALDSPDNSEDNVANPQNLKKGDVLATGERVVSEPEKSPSRPEIILTLSIKGDERKFLADPRIHLAKISKEDATSNMLFAIRQLL